MKSEKHIDSITVCIVDDDRELSAGMEYIIQSVDGFMVLGVFHSYYETLDGLEALGDTLPDVILMDIGMKGKDGIACVREVTKRYPSIHVIMQTIFTSDDKIFDSLRAGAVGYILKNTTKEKLIDAIKEAHDGGAPMTGSIAKRVLTYFQKTNEPSGTEHLSARELEVLTLLVKGHSYKAIGEQLFISSFTVRHHLHNMYQKLHVSSRGEAVAKVQHEFPSRQ